jgi:hypothetical protein
LHTHTPVVLVSDADILWTKRCIDALSQRLQLGFSYVHVAHVIEQHPGRPESHQRLRCDLSTQCTLRIALDRRNIRPGYGLVLARRKAMLRIGGYCEAFVGWGWEDLDLLTRGHMLDLRVSSAGTVTHLSHGDDVRDLLDGQSRAASRNANICRALASYRAGQWQGALGSQNTRLDRPIAIVVTRGAKKLICVS